MYKSLLQQNNNLCFTWNIVKQLPCLYHACTDFLFRVYMSGNQSLHQKQKDTKSCLHYMAWKQRMFISKNKIMLVYNLPQENNLRGMDLETGMNARSGFISRHRWWSIKNKQQNCQWHRSAEKHYSLKKLPKAMNAARDAFLIFSDGHQSTLICLQMDWNRRRCKLSDQTDCSWKSLAFAYNETVFSFVVSDAFA